MIQSWIFIMKIDGLIVVETIESVEQSMPQQNISEDFKVKVENLILLARIMKDRLTTNSTNSSKPPSKDDLKDKGSKEGEETAEGKNKPKPTRKAGGQKGHAGSQLSLLENPDEIIYIPYNEMTNFTGDYSFDDYQVRQVIDLKISRHVTEYRAEILTGQDGNKYYASFPENVSRPAQYSADLKAHAVYMSQYQLIPYGRTAQQINDATEFSISTGSIYNFNCEAYNGLADFQKWLITTQTQASVLHADETGANINGQNHWLHSLSNEVSTYFHIDKKRGSTAMDTMNVLPNFQGILCHDHWKSYYKYQCVHALCNAHHLRELKRAYEQDDQQWAKSLELLLLEMNDAVNESSTGILTEDEIKDYEKRYIDILEAGKNECPEISTKTSNKKGRVKRTRPRNLLLRLLNYMGDTLRFVSESDVPFTNNNAEREIRMTKVQQKISGCFRSMLGAKMFCLIRSYIITSRKHGISPIEALKMLFRGEKPAYMGS